MESVAEAAIIAAMSKYITKGRLISAMEKGKAEGYNHQVDEATINALDPAHHYPILTVIPHEHKDGQRSEMHARILVEIRTRSGKTENLLIDVPEELYEALPDAPSAN